MHTIIRRLSLIAAVAVGAMLSACATWQASPEETITQRANQRWQALIKGDMAKAYSYNTPGYKAVVDVDGFKARTGIAGRWHDAKVVRVECEQADRCKAIIRLEFSALFSGRAKDRIETHIDETWLQEDGQWWIFQKI